MDNFGNRHNEFFYNWGRWSFTEEAEECLLSELCQIKSDSQMPEYWQSLFSRLPKDTEISEKDDESFLESDRSTDDDDDWEEIKSFMPKHGNDVKQTNEFDMRKLVESLPDFAALAVEELLLDRNADVELKPEEVIFSDIVGGEDEAKFPKRTNLGLHEEFSRCSLLEQTIDSILAVGDNEDQEGNEGDENVVQLLAERLSIEEPDQDEINNIVRSRKITREQLTDIWQQLESDSARFSLCKSLASNNLYGQFQCQHFLLPWINNSSLKDRKDIVENVAKILPLFIDAAIKHLLLPLVSDPNGVFVKDTDLLKDLMCRVMPEQWALLLREFVNNVTMNLDKWHFSVISAVIEQIKEFEVDTNTINKLLSLMSTAVVEYPRDKDFGTLVVSFADLVAKGKAQQSVVKALTDIAELYKGVMRFKVMSIVKKLPV